MKEVRDNMYIEEGGPTYAAQSLPQYISAFATRVLQSTCVKRERELEKTYIEYQCVCPVGSHDFEF
jgi:hypothetical protein